MTTGLPRNMDQEVSKRMGHYPLPSKAFAKAEMFLLGLGAVVGELYAVYHVIC